MLSGGAGRAVSCRAVFSRPSAVGGHRLIVAVALVGAGTEPREAQRTRRNDAETVVTTHRSFGRRDHSGHQKALADCARREMNVTFPRCAEGTAFGSPRLRPLIAS